MAGGIVSLQGMTAKHASQALTSIDTDKYVTNVFEVLRSILSEKHLKKVMNLKPKLIRFICSNIYCNLSSGQLLLRKKAKKH